MSEKIRKYQIIKKTPSWLLSMLCLMNTNVVYLFLNQFLILDWMSPEITFSWQRLGFWLGFWRYWPFIAGNWEIYTCAYFPEYAFVAYIDNRFIDSKKLGVIGNSDHYCW